MTSNDKAKRAGVDHSYHDYAHVSAADATRMFPDAASGGTARQHNPTATLTQQQGFVVKLYHMLNDADGRGQSSIVSWQPHGRCFVVRDRDAFVERVLPNYFLQSNFASFQRQLNLYGFKRLSSAQDRGGYYHELFLRGKPELACFIQRIKRKGLGPRKPDSPDSEPDFYSMPFLPSTAKSPRARTSGYHDHGGCSRLQMYPTSESTSTKITLKHLLPGASSSAKSHSKAPAQSSGVKQTKPLRPQVAKVTNFLETSYNEVDHFPKHMFQANRMGRIAAAGPCHQWGAPWHASASPCYSRPAVGQYCTFPLISGDFSGQASSGAQGGSHNGSGAIAFSGPRQGMPYSSRVGEHNEYSHFDDATQHLKEERGSYELGVNNISGNLTPTSWDNAFGEDEEFWT